MPISIPITIRDHTKLLNIGSLSHATIDGYLDQAVKQASSPSFAYLKLTTAPSVGHIYTCSNVDGTGGWAAPTGGGISNVVEDLTPQLGGNLDCNDKTIYGSAASGGNLTLISTSHGTVGSVICSGNSIVSTPAVKLPGAWFTGGTATTTKPHFLIEPTGTTSTGWSTLGTGLGINAASGFAGNLIDLQVGGNTKFSVYTTGNTTVVGNIYSNTGVFSQNFNNAATIISTSVMTTADHDAVDMAIGTVSNTSGYYRGVVIKPTYNQLSGTSINTDLLINRTQTAVGSGAQLLFNGQVNNTSLAHITNSGYAKFVGGLTIGEILGGEIAGTTAAEYTYTPASPGWSATDAPLVFTRTSSASNLTIVQTTQTISAGTWYKVVYTIGGSVAGSIIASVGGTSAISRTMAVGTYTEYLYAVATTHLTFTVVTATTGTISDISCKAITMATSAGDIMASGMIFIDGTQVVSNRVIDARIDDTINDTIWDSTTAGVLDAIRDACITHGLIAAA